MLYVIFHFLNIFLLDMSFYLERLRSGSTPIFAHGSTLVMYSSLSIPLLASSVIHHLSPSEFKGRVYIFVFELESIDGGLTATIYIYILLILFGTSIGGFGVWFLPTPTLIHFDVVWSMAWVSLVGLTCPTYIFNNFCFLKTKWLFFTLSRIMVIRKINHLANSLILDGRIPSIMFLWSCCLLKSALGQVWPKQLLQISKAYGLIFECVHTIRIGQWNLLFYHVFTSIQWLSFLSYSKSLINSKCL